MPDKDNITESPTEILYEQAKAHYDLSTPNIAAKALFDRQSVTAERYQAKFLEEVLSARNREAVLATLGLDLNKTLRQSTTPYLKALSRAALVISAPVLATELSFSDLPSLDLPHALCILSFHQGEVSKKILEKITVLLDSKNTEDCLTGLRTIRLIAPLLDTPNLAIAKRLSSLLSNSEKEKIIIETIQTISKIRFDVYMDKISLRETFFLFNKDYFQLTPKRKKISARVASTGVFGTAICEMASNFKDSELHESLKQELASDFCLTSETKPQLNRQLIDAIDKFFLLRSPDQARLFLRDKNNFHPYFFPTDNVDFKNIWWVVALCLKLLGAPAKEQLVRVTIATINKTTAYATASCLRSDWLQATLDVLLKILTVKLPVAVKSAAVEGIAKLAPLLTLEQIDNVRQLLSSSNMAAELKDVIAKAQQKLTYYRQHLTTTVGQPPKKPEKLSYKEFKVALPSIPAQLAPEFWWHYLQTNYPGSYHKLSCTNWSKEDDIIIAVDEIFETLPLELFTDARAIGITTEILLSVFIEKNTLDLLERIPYRRLEETYQIAGILKKLNELLANDYKGNVCEQIAIIIINAMPFHLMNPPYTHVLDDLTTALLQKAGAEQWHLQQAIVNAVTRIPFQKITDTTEIMKLFKWAIETTKDKQATNNLQRIAATVISALRYDLVAATNHLYKDYLFVIKKLNSLLKHESPYVAEAAAMTLSQTNKKTRKQIQSFIDDALAVARSKREKEIQELPFKAKELACKENESTDTQATLDHFIAAAGGYISKEEILQQYPWLNSEVAPADSPSPSNTPPEAESVQPSTSTHEALQRISLSSPTQQPVAEHVTFGFSTAPAPSEKPPEEKLEDLKGLYDSFPIF